MKTGIIIQARSSSTRLPGKVLKPLPFNSSITVLEQVIRRTQKARLAQEVIVATTTDLEDSAIIAIAEKCKVPWFRGSKNNVLERYYGAAREHSLDIIVRITSDCPCIDPAVIDKVIDHSKKTASDYTSNVVTRTFPHGMDTEVFTFKALETAYSNASLDMEKEHVTPYITRTNAGSFSITSLEAPEALRAPDIRITLDTQDDYVLLCAVYDYLYKRNEFFGVKMIVNLFKQRPWLKLINQKTIHKKTYDSVEDELRDAIRLLDMQELMRAKKILENNLK